MDATWWACRRGGPRPLVPIGRPIANAQAYILDTNGKPVAPGVPGELYIGGAGLARGYLNAPDLTAERFLPDPFSTSPPRGSTGRATLPMASRRQSSSSDGTTTRSKFAATASSSAKSKPRSERSVGREAAGRGACGYRWQVQLVAYIVGVPTVSRSRAESLRRNLKERLPEYMMPAAFVTLAAMPRTAGGKVDRRALPAPPNERRTTARPCIAPRTALEQYLASIWRDVLGIEGVGVDDNFFELGGNSIQGAVLINRLQERIGHHVSVIALFDSPTIAGLANFLGDACPDVVRASSGGSRSRAQIALAPTARPIVPSQWNWSSRCSLRDRERPGSWSILPAGSSSAIRRYRSGWAGIGPSTPSDREACMESRICPVRWRRWPTSTSPPSGRCGGVDLTCSEVGPRADWLLWRWPSSFWGKESRSRCLP